VFAHSPRDSSRIGQALDKKPNRHQARGAVRPCAALSEKHTAVSVESPCKNICQMHEPSGHCIGCGRTLDEITLWSVLDDDDKRAIWALLPERLAELPPEALNPG
jgi:uncharacterized protein